MTKYTPIDCNFYDELVLLSMHKTPVVFIPNKYEIAKGDYIADLITTTTKEEFMVMKSGIKIRLDEITTADNELIFLAANEMFFEEE